MITGRISQKKIRIMEYMRTSENGEIVLLNSMLMNSLSPTERSVLDWIRENPGSTSREVCRYFNTTINASSNVLKTLLSVGFLSRTDAIPHHYYVSEKQVKDHG